MLFRGPPEAILMCQTPCVLLGVRDPFVESIGGKANAQLLPEGEPLHGLDRPPFFCPS